MGMTHAEAGRLGYEKSKLYWEEKWRLMRIDYYKTPKHCKGCKNIIPYEVRRNIFCSSSCGAIYNNKPRIRPSICINCNKEYRRKNRGKYCSVLCYEEDIWKMRKDKFEKGLIKDRKALRSIMIKLFGNKCFNCKLEKWMDKPIPIEVHHEDGNSENNKPENVKLLCLNCHGQTPTFKGKNKGSGRHYRRERYRKGLSY